MTPLPTLRQDFEGAMEVLREPGVQVIGHVRRVDLDVSCSVYEHQPEVSAA